MFKVDEIFPREILAYEDAVRGGVPGRFVEVGGKRVHYVEQGRGAPLLLLHGFLYHLVMWRRNLGALAEKFRVFALDLPGFGYSERISLKGPLDFRLYAPQVLDILDALELERVSIVAHSMGGGVAVRLAALAPERVERLVLSGPHIMPYRIRVKADLLKVPMERDFVTGPGSGLVRMMLAASLFPDPQRISAEYAAEVFRPLAIDGSNVVIRGGMQSALDPPFIEEDARAVARSGKRVLLVQGGRDPVIPRAASRAFVDLSENFRMEVFEEAGHTPHEEEAERFNELVVDFLSRP